MRVRLLAAALAAGLAAPAGAEAPPPLPFDIGGPFALIDQHGTPRTEAALVGTPSLLFFGYAQCQAICTVALPRLAETVDLLTEAGVEVRPVLVTVDPVRDTPEALREAAPRVHPRLLALTGSEAALAAARKAYRVESELIGEDIEGPLYSHGSFLYLLDDRGNFLTLLPPILGPERMAKIARKYLDGRAMGQLEPVGTR